MAILLGLTLLCIGAICGGLYVMRLRSKLFFRNLSEEQRAALTAARVPFEVAPLERNGPPGVLVRRFKLGAVCKALNSYVLTTWKTKRPGIVEAALRPVRAPAAEAMAPVFFMSGQRRNAGITSSVRRPTEALIREIVAPKVGCTVIVHSLHGRQTDPIDDNRFHIFVHSSARNGSASQVPGSVLGFRSSVSRPAIRTAAVGIPLTDPETHYVFGDIVGTNCIYLHHNALASGGPRLVQLAAILDFAMQRVQVESGLEDVIAAIGGAPLDETVAAVQAKISEPRRKHILERLAAATIRGATPLPIVIDDGAGSSKEPSSSANEFYIHYNCRPRGLAPHAILPTGAGIPISGRGGSIAAELIGTNLFIHTDVLRFGLKPHVEELAELMCAARDNLDEGAEAARRRVERFAAQCAQSLLTSVQTMPANGELTASEEKLTELMTRARDNERTLTRADMSAEEQLGREFDSILAVRKVRDVRVTATEMIVETDTIYCIDPRSGFEHEIGRFRFHLQFDGGVRFWNTSHQIRGYSGNVMNAPHVNSEGRPCLGNIRDLMPQLIQDRQFASAVQIAIAFLESVNVDDAWGRGINSWPIHNRTPRR